MTRESGVKWAREHGSVMMMMRLPAYSFSHKPQSISHSQLTSTRALMLDLEGPMLVKKYSYRVEILA